MPGATPHEQVGPEPPTRSGCESLPFGRFEYRVSTRTLWWSEGTYAIYGFAPGDVVPSPELLMSHHHPQDRADLAAAQAQVIADGTPFSLTYRIVDARRRERTVVCSGHGERDESGQVVQVSGYLVDLTESVRSRLADSVTAAVQRSAETRAAIEQAKGVLMVTFDITEDEAFDLLRWHSAHANVKLREVARHLVGRFADPEIRILPPRQRASAVLDSLAPHRTQPVPTDVLPPRALRRPGRPGPPPASSIPADELPRTLFRAVASAGQSITIADCRSADLPLVFMNPAFFELTGYLAAEVLGRNCRFLQGPETDRAEVAAMSRAIAEGREVRSVLRNYRRDGTAFWNEIHLSPVLDETGRLTHFIGYQIDVSERVDQERQLYQLAYYDAVTGLPHDRLGAIQLDAAIAAAGTAGVTVIWLEVKGSSPDSTADSLMSALATRLRDAVPATAGVARMDRDTFMVTESGPNAPGLAALVRELLDQPLPLPDGPVEVIAVLGVASSDASGVGAAELIERARSASAS